jgi:hypothetical protein
MKFSPWIDDFRREEPRSPLSNVCEPIILCSIEERIFIVPSRYNEKYVSANDEMHI